MGKDVYIYGLNFQKLRTGFSHLFAADRDTKLFFESCMWAKMIDPATVLHKLKQAGETFQIDDVWHLHDFFHDWWEEQYGSAEYKELGRQLGHLGIDEIFEISITNPSVVFMSEFYRCFPNLETDILEVGEDLYRLSKNQLYKFLNQLEAVCRYIYEQEERPEKFDERSFRPEMLPMLEGLYARICKERASGSTDYMGRWGEDYFAFCYGELTYTHLKNEVDQFDEFIILDSY